MKSKKKRNNEEALKHDDGKLRMDLMPWECLDELAKVLTYGAKKYKDNSWQGVETYRYEGALLRHLSRHFQGESTDPESGLLHLSHAFCNLAFILWQNLKRGSK